MKISLVRDVKPPSRGTSGSAGIDFYIPNDISGVTGNCSSLNQKIIIRPHGDALIPSGVKARVPKGMALVAFNKSGVAVKKGLLVGACVVDEDYQGEIHLHMTNKSGESVALEIGEKIVQFILIPYSNESVDVVPFEDLYLEATERGDGGFGSTGVS